MKISVVCSDPTHPVYPHLERWCTGKADRHDVELVSKTAELTGGDLLLLISCSEIVSVAVRRQYEASLVVHASDLPQGRGWSPLIWQILEGRNDIAVSLLEAADPVDSGAIWKKLWLHFDGTELFDEINALLFDAEVSLIDFAVENYGRAQPRAQEEKTATWYRRRNPEDSRIDPHRTLAEQFELLRVTDPLRYPAFFEFRGACYEIAIRKRPANA